MKEYDGFGLSTLGQIAVRVHDLQKALPFYRDVLGVRFLFEVPKMAFFERAGVRVMLAMPEGPESDHPSSILYFKVDDLQAAYDEFLYET